MFDFNKKIVVVTGGGSGIGQAIALRFAFFNARVIVLDMDAAGGQRTCQLIEQAGGEAAFYTVNVANQTEVKATFDLILKAHGPAHIVSSNAGISHIGSLETTSEADFDRVFQVNVKGTYNVMYAALDHFLTNKAGCILNMASVAAGIGIADRFAYSMSKGAVYAMTLSVARDYVDKNIRCNSISPGRVHTPFVDNFLAKNYPGQEQEMFEKLSKSQPIGRMAKPEEVADLAIFLCSDQAAFITGCDYPIDGGFLHLK